MNQETQEPAAVPEVIDCQEFHELCMDYRGAVSWDEGKSPQAAYERLQQYLSRALATSTQDRIDAERMDWIEANVTDIRQCLDELIEVSYHGKIGRPKFARGKGLRAAIDAAMTAEKGKT